MCKIICVTARRLCREDFLLRLERLARGGVDAIILREKDLEEGAYETLAERALEVCAKQGAACVLHTYAAVAARLDCPAIHLPLGELERLSREEPELLSRFPTVGASIHGVEEAERAQALGASYLTAGHIFATDCKRGAPPRGVDFLQGVCGRASVPVYAIGGISPDNLPQVRAAGAAGACLMSSLMSCSDPEGELERLRRAWEG